MTHKRRLYASVVLLAVTLVGSCSQAAAPPQAPPAPNAILVSWDGADRSVLKELLDAGKLPSLAALIKDGSLQDIEVVGHRTETAPGHAQMLTGLSPEDSRVRDNGHFEPVPEGLTIFERVQKHLGPDAVRTIMVTSKVGYMGGQAPREAYSLTRKHLTAFDSKARPAAETGPVCLDLLAKHHAPRFLAFFHFRDPDSAGHGYGISSPEYRAAIVTCDEWLGKIVAWLKEQKLYDSTLVYVTADHGFDPRGRSHSNAPHIWLATNDTLVKRGGVQADIPATILARFGVDIVELEPKLVGTDLACPAKAPAKEPEPAGATQ